MHNLVKGQWTLDKLKQIEIRIMEDSLKEKTVSAKERLTSLDGELRMWLADNHVEASVVKDLTNYRRHLSRMIRQIGDAADALLAKPNVVRALRGEPPMVEQLDQLLHRVNRLLLERGAETGAGKEGDRALLTPD
jgi:hypothetical protein